MDVRSGLGRTTLGFVALYAVLVGGATATNSLYGEAGWLIAFCVLFAALIVEGGLYGRRPLEALGDLGTTVRPLRQGVHAAGIVVGLLSLALVGIAVFSESTGLRPEWGLMMLGLFLQGGMAEEVVFRGYLFRHLRVGRSFRSASLISMVPFVLAHGYLFFTMDAMVATAAVIVAVSTSIPLARLFEMGGRSVWPCALAHWATHFVKLVVLEESRFALAQLAWMAVVMIVPWVVFAWRPVPE